MTKILLVEDEAKIAALLGDFLGANGFEHHWVERGDEALAAFNAVAPELVLLDLNLPGYDGYQVLQQMKQDERTKRIPVVILTTTDDSREVAKCYDLGCNVYITKPVDYAQFSQAIRKIGLFLSVVTVPNGE